MKILSILILLFLILSCNGTNCVIKNPEKNYRFISKKKLDVYELSTYAFNSDTILIVIKKEIAEKCSNLKSININNPNILRISTLKDKNAIIDFYYKIKSTNGLEIISGNGEPGTERNPNQIYSYKSLPYLITDCAQFN